MQRLVLSYCAALAAASLLAGCSGEGLVGSGVTPRVAPASTGQRQLRAALSTTSLLQSVFDLVTESLCEPLADPDRASCLGTVRVAASTTSVSAPVGGLAPDDLATLYAYPAPESQGATSQVVGVVVAYDSATAESDLAAYRSYYGLPPCTTANGCLRKVGAGVPGQTTTSTSRAPSSISANPTVHPLPTPPPSPATAASPAAVVDALRAPGSISANPTTNYSGWAAEVDADLEVVSAVCPKCRIVLAEAASDQLGDLGAATTAAIDAGATIVSASFGAVEDATQTQYESLFENAKVKVVAAAGDNGPQLLFPASATGVVAVAGTTVTANGSTVTETLWSGSGGGCSAVFARPAWQSGSCGMRNVADLAAVGDPNTGLAFYDAALGGWGVVGGTSVSAPIVASMWALSGDVSSLPGAQRLYALAQHDLPVGGGGAIVGLGVPNGLGAF